MFEPNREALASFFLTMPITVAVGLSLVFAIGFFTALGSTMLMKVTSFWVYVFTFVTGIVGLPGCISIIARFAISP